MAIRPVDWCKLHFGDRWRAAYLVLKNRRVSGLELTEHSVGWLLFVQRKLEPDAYHPMNHVGRCMPGRQSKAPRNTRVDSEPH